MSARRPAILFYDTGCWLCRMCREALQSGALEDLRFEDANDHELAAGLGVKEPAKLDQGICLVRPDGSNLWGYDAIVELASWRPATAALARILALPTVARIGRAIYAWVSRNRSWISKP
jgi:predicted DCC family thiol-disulfide oxidoreductase YuxK